MSLILPPHVRVEHRPYRTASTIELMQELHYRDVLHELSGSQQMIRDSAITLDAEPYNQMRQSVMAALLQQMGLAIGQSGRCLLLSELRHDPRITQGYELIEVIHAKVIVCKHPNLDPNNREEIIWKTEQPVQAQTEPTPELSTSSLSDEE